MLIKTTLNCNVLMNIPEEKNDALAALMRSAQGAKISQIHKNLAAMLVNAESKNMLPKSSKPNKPHNVKDKELVR